MKALVLFAAVLCVSGAAADDCASGPSFWCASQRNAKVCGSETYCAENCWSFAGRVRDFWRSHAMKRNRLPDARFASMCTGTNRGSTSNFKGAVCDDCKAVVADIDALLKDPAALESLTAALRFFCNFVPAYSTLCREAVTDLASIASALEPFFNDSERACKRMNMCPGRNSTASALLSLFENVYSADARVFRDNTLCDDCQQACHDIVAQLQDPAQQQNIKETFEELCDYVGPLKNKCIQYIDQFVPQLIQWIISRFTDPLGLCTQLGFCG